MGKRSVRRHHAQRLKARARWVMTTQWHAELSPRHVGRNASTHCVPCSCFLCTGHKSQPRHSVRKRTIEEV